MEMSQGNSLYSYLKQTTSFCFQKWRQEGRTDCFWDASTSKGVGKDVGEMV
jgi:hypothetical protein